MNPSEMRAKVAEKLLAELKGATKLKWYYIAIDSLDGTPAGGYFLQAFGDTDAWCKMHSLNLYQRDRSGWTSTTRIPDVYVARAIGDDKRWRMLSPEEIKALPQIMPSEMDDA